MNAGRVSNRMTKFQKEEVMVTRDLSTLDEAPEADRSIPDYEKSSPLWFVHKVSKEINFNLELKC